MSQNPGNPFEKRVYVTRPFLPPIEEVAKLLADVWERRILTNNGPLHQQLEEELAAYLGVEHLSLFANGTLALLVALKALRLQGEVITTPYSFIASSEALSWNNLQPVFADIDPRTFCLDPASIEASITPRTSAILAVHCYGMPCDVEAIQRIADNYNLRVVYDAAHAFGVDCHCGSVLQHGDLSVLSFHATKVFTTFEGGAIICPDSKTKKRIDRLKNFGFVNEETVAANGINAKMSELHAAVGLAQLPCIEAAIEGRKKVAETYYEGLKGLPSLRLPDYSVAKKPNYAYYPILVNSDAPIGRDELMQRLSDYGIMPRRYFYPLIPEFQYYRSNPSADPRRYPKAKQIAGQVLCLPIYPELSIDIVSFISQQIVSALDYPCLSSEDSIGGPQVEPMASPPMRTTGKRWD